MGEFSWRRVGRLIQDRMVGDLVPLGIGVLVALGVLLLTWALTGLWGLPLGLGNPEGAPWIPLVVLGCLMTTSRGFRDMQSSRSVTDWILLPATSFEKFLAAALRTQVLVPVAASLAGLGLWLISSSFGVTKAMGQWESWAVFAVTNLWFLAGSTVFRRWAFLKTAAAALGFLIAMMVIPALVTARFWYDRAAGPGPEAPWLVNALWYTGAFGLTPAAALAFGFFRVNEKEARDAVQ
jgi:hypothetical protein